jgi:hypothetical protein
MASPVSATALLSLQRARENYLSTGIPAFDRVMPGLPRGAITEVTGARSSGKTSFLHSILATVTNRSEFCAVIDTCSGFDPDSAAQAGVELARLIWVRCDGNLEYTIKATDLLIHGGGFGLLCLDLSDASPKLLNRIPISYWFRFRRAVEDTSTVFLVLANRPQVKSCTACWIEFCRAKQLWTGDKSVRLLRGFSSESVLQKPGPPKEISLAVKAV